MCIVDIFAVPPPTPLNVLFFRVLLFYTIYRDEYALKVCHKWSPTTSAGRADRELEKGPS